MSETREQLLTRLAMEMPSWPTADTLNVRLTDNGNGTTRWSWVYSDDEAGFSKADWLAERERLINRPSWSDAPEWAQWLAQDAGGRWFWFLCKPMPLSRTFDFGKTARFANTGAIPASHDWRQTLEQRPQEEWPEERIDRIAQSDGSGDHYPKQQRYQDNQGDDWIDECARTMTPEQFRGAMLFTIGKYLRRMGKKDAIESEVRKVADYAQRWQQYEEAINEHGA